MRKDNRIPRTGYGRSFLILVLIFFFSSTLPSCSSSLVGRKYGSRAREASEHSDRKRQRFASSLKAPWELWEPIPLASSELAQADDFAAHGRLFEAIGVYRTIEEQTSDQRLREVVFQRRVGTLLKTGQSREVLVSLAKYVDHRGENIEDMNALLSLIAAFAYEHQRDLNQTFAWLGMSYKKAGAGTRVAARALQEANRLVEYLPQDLLETYAVTWAQDPVIGPLLIRERFQRSQGKKERAKAMTPDWFSSSTYGQELSPGTGAESTLTGESTSSGIPQPTSSTTVGQDQERQITLGVLLPFRGKYASHAARVREGIELAVEEPPYRGNVRLAIRDTQGEPEIAAQEYEQLVTQEKASFILGPLLLSTTKSVAEKSQTVSVGFLSFTKKQGVPEMGQNVFRLGTTAHDQVVDLISYANKGLNVKTFAILYPENSGADELVGAFEQEVSLAGFSLTGKESYLPGDEESVSRALGQLEQQNQQQSFEAIFLPDSLDNVWPVLERLKSSPLASKILLGPASWDDKSLLRGFGRFLDGAIFVSGFYLESTSPQVVAFVHAYRLKFNKDPNLLSAQAYDAAKYVLHTVDFSRPDFSTLTPESFIQKLRLADTFSGVSGKLSTSKSRDIQRRMKVLRLHQGQVVEVMSDGTLTGVITQ